MTDHSERQVPSPAREELLALKSGSVFACARTDGDIRGGHASGEGLYADDTRHLSELRLTVGGHEPVLLSAAMESGHHAVIHQTTPALRGNDGGAVPWGTLDVRRTVVVADRLHYAVRVRNFHSRAVATTVELWLGADFADVFEVRGMGRRTSGRVLAPTCDHDHVRLAYLAADGERRGTEITLSPTPTQATVDDQRAHVAWDLELAAGEAISLLVTVLPAQHAQHGPVTLEHATATLQAEHDAWVGACARVSTDNVLFDRVLGASVRDLHALMMPADGGQLPAAGIPWYVAPFGRDALLTACEALMINPEVARGTLLVLAGLQARVDDAWRDAEPGKILHELRTGELARTGATPHTPYYGTADATPLLLMLAGRYYRWTRDLDTMAQLRPAFDAALTWIDDWGDRDGDGFVEYERRSSAGLFNQGWKDSEDCIVHADGSLAEGPIALVEVQGYVYDAKLQMADVYDALGSHERAGELRGEAAALRVAFNETFWDADEGFLVLALDGRKQQVRSVTSNAAHCLYSGIVDDDKAALVAERLMAPDMYSGWGIRTLSSDSPAYNPMSYHNGSIWPHDNAIAAAGLKRYGFDVATGQIASAMFDVATAAPDYRLPELFCGFDRDGSRVTVGYPVACVPQAWAAAAPFLVLQAMLGISADASDERLTVDRPVLPDWLSTVDIAGLRVGSSRLDLSFRRTGSDTRAFSPAGTQGDVRVTTTNP